MLSKNHVSDSLNLPRKGELHRTNSVIELFSASGRFNIDRGKIIVFMGIVSRDSMIRSRQATDRPPWFWVLCDGRIGCLSQEQFNTLDHFDDAAFEESRP